MKYCNIDLAPLGRAGAFADAVWKDGLGKGSDFRFFNVPFRLMAPVHTADAPFKLEIPSGTWAEAALLFAIDEANAAALPFATLRFTAGGVSGDVTLDLRCGNGPTVAPEVGRILRGPRGTLHFPVRFARLPLHPAPAAAAAAEHGGPMTLEFLPAEGFPCAFSVAALTLMSRAPLKELSGGFTLSCRLNLDGATGGETLYEAEGALRIVVRDALADPAPGEYDERYGNYLNFPLPDGTCPVVEALLPGATGRIGIPLGALERHGGGHDLRIVHNGTYFTIDLDGRRDEDFPIAPLLWPQDDPGAALSPRVSDLHFAFDAPEGPVPRMDGGPASGFHAMYWTPRDHNQWLGDVVTTEWDGALHVFYLVDRRHHNSKGGRGGHWFEHLVSDDLVHWHELPAAVPMDVATEYIGTGTPFRMDGKYCLAYGLHTTRHGPLEEITRMGLPIGGTYAVSDDGVHFVKSHRMITDDQNPSVYNRADGLFGMGCVRTLMKAPAIDGPWETAVSGAPVFGDCPCPFEWNGRHYIIQGFCTMAKSESGANGSYTDEVLAGYDIYEGLSVPMVAPWQGNRRLLIGWINHRYGWGGWLCFRELVQYPAGHLGTRWVPEIPMPVEPAVFQVEPGARFQLEFRAASPRGADFALILDTAAAKARFVEKAADGSYPEVPTLQELAIRHEKTYGRERIRAGRKYRPDEAGDFAIGNIRGLDRPFAVRVVNYFDAKAGISLIDVEIAGQRTMVTRRFGTYTI